MKKIFISFLFASLLISCSSDDDAAPQHGGQDPVVGSWSPEKHVLVYADGSVTEEPFSDCEQTNTIIFFEDGYLDMNFHYDYGDGCEIETTTLEGTWTWVNDIQYSIYVKVYYDGDVTDTDVINTVLELSFPETGVLYLHDQEILEFFQDQGEDVVDYYTFLYKN